MNAATAAVTTVNFAESAFVPLAVGFMGLGTGYLIYGPQELLKFPGRDRTVDLTTGIWGVWMPGFLQFITGVYLFVGLTWFHSFTAKPLYMAALAFTVFGVHWWAIGMARAMGGDSRPNALMSIPLELISILGAIVFFKAGDNPVGALFVGLALIYIAEFFASLGSVGQELATRALGLLRIVTGLWLMYLTFAITLNITLGYHWSV
jgi:hypothetical protein